MSTSNMKCGELSLSDGADGTLRSGRQGDLIVSELHGRYFETTFRKRMFSSYGCVANAAPGQTAIAFTQGTTVASFLGFCLSNPLGNTFNLVVNKISWAYPVIPTTVNTTLLLTGYSATTNVTHTTPAIIAKSNFVGSGATPTAKTDNAFTLPVTPDIVGTLSMHPSAITLEGSGFLDLEGSIILAPGAYLVINPLAVSAAAGWMAGAWWEELPI